MIKKNENSTQNVDKKVVDIEKVHEDKSRSAKGV